MSANYSVPRDGYFGVVRPKTDDKVTSLVPHRPGLSQEIDGQPLGHILDASRSLMPPLSAVHQGLVDDVKNTIGGDDGTTAAAELECVLRSSLKGFTLTPTHHLATIRQLARNRGMIIRTDPV